MTIDNGDTSLQAQTTSQEKPVYQQLGIEGLDSILHGGLPAGNVMLVQGAPGTGKSILGMQFLYEGAVKFKTPGIFITFEEEPRRIARDAQSLGWDFELLESQELLRLVYTSPSVFLKDLETDHYGQIIRGCSGCRIVVDSLTHFEAMPQKADEGRIRFARIVNGLRQAGALIMMTREVNTRDTLHSVTPEEYIADTVIQMDYRLGGEHRTRLIEVLKHRGSSHSETQHNYAIAHGGIQIITN